MGSTKKTRKEMVCTGVRLPRQIRAKKDPESRRGGSNLEVENRCLQTRPHIEKTSAPRTRAKPHDRREEHKGEGTANDAKREKHDQRSGTARAGGGERQTEGGGIKGQDYQPEPST